MKNITVNCDGVKISNKEKICLIAGPCQLENEQHALDMAGKISEISKKYKNLYQVNESEMPSDIQSMIDNKELGAALLRIIEVIGPDKIEDIDDDTFSFIISTLNQLNTDLIRNKLLLKVLPLKV